MGQNYSDEAREKRRAYTREWRKRNPNKLKAVQKKRLAEGRTYKAVKKYASKNPEKIKEWHKKYRERNKDKLKVQRIVYLKAYYQINKDKIKANAKAYRKTPAGKAAEKRGRDKRRATLHGRLRHNVSSGVRFKLLNHGGKKYWASIDKVLPFKIEDLITRLESMFKPGMTWDNYGEWHIDHIKADSSFCYTTVNCSEFKEAWALDNLQPLWAHENFAKSNK